MSKISRQEVARVADLAKIELTETELDKLAYDIDVIADAVASVATIVDADTPATSHPIPTTNVMRADVPVTPLTVEQALSGAPARENGQFLVPQILGEDA